MQTLAREATPHPPRHTPAQRRPARAPDREPNEWLTLLDRRPAAIAQRRAEAMLDARPAVQRVTRLQAAASTALADPNQMSAGDVGRPATIASRSPLDLARVTPLRPGYQLVPRRSGGAGTTWTTEFRSGDVDGAPGPLQLASRDGRVLQAHFDDAGYSHVTQLASWADWGRGLIATLVIGEGAALIVAGNAMLATPQLHVSGVTTIVTGGIKVLRGIAMLVGVIWGDNDKVKTATTVIADIFRALEAVGTIIAASWGLAVTVPGRDEAATDAATVSGSIDVAVGGLKVVRSIMQGVDDKNKTESTSWLGTAAQGIETLEGALLMMRTQWSSPETMGYPLGIGTSKLVRGGVGIAVNVPRTKTAEEQRLITSDV